MKYDRVHKMLGEGSFVLVIAEGSFGDRRRRTTIFSALRTEKSPSTGIPWKRFHRAANGRIQTENSNCLLTQQHQCNRVRSWGRVREITLTGSNFAPVVSKGVKTDIARAV